jgi:hypothetical protein
MARSLDEILANVREQCGKLTLDQVSDEDLHRQVKRAFHWACDRWQTLFTTQPQAVALTEDGFRYPVPENFLHMVLVEHNGKRLTPSSVHQWQRDGADYRNAASGYPQEFAIQGRQLLIYPPPSEDALDDDGFLTLNYVRCTVGAELPDWADLDLDAVEYKAAVYWLGVNPGKDEVTQKTRSVLLQTNSAFLEERLVQADRRHANAIQDFYPGAAVWSRRSGGAR